MKFYIHKLGCPKNDVDADYMAARLIAAGHDPVKRPESADSVIVNTCGFINSAKEESINEILHLGQLKKKGTLKTMYAAGCLAQRHGDDMIAAIEELDGAFGHGALDSLAEAVTDSKQLTKTIKMETRKLGYLSWKNRFISDDFPYAYLKVSDGCDRACTYCAIPGMRGRFRSRPIDSIVREANYLAENGKRELILVSQEATLYGYDFKEGVSLIPLLRELDKIKRIDWIRLLYLHPTELHQDLIEYMAEDNKTLNYYDLPLQHINSDVLARMRRQVDRPEIERKLRLIRQISPGATIRTTFIVGFPGETKEQYAELREFVREEQFDRMGVFAYSAEEDTAAVEFERQIPEKTKAERLEELMLLQQAIAFEKNNNLIGTSAEVIIDSVDDQGRTIGRMWTDCPDVDQEVIIESDPPPVPGSLVRTEITGTEGYDLTAIVVKD